MNHDDHRHQKDGDPILDLIERSKKRAVGIFMFASLLLTLARVLTTELHDTFSMSDQTTTNLPARVLAARTPYDSPLRAPTDHEERCWPQDGGVRSIVPTLTQHTDTGLLPGTSFTHHLPPTPLLLPYLCWKILPRRTMSKEDSIEVTGTVVEKFPSGLFSVQLDQDRTVLAHLAGKLRRNRIRVLAGDRVTMELSPYDLTKGRITYRHK